MWSGSLAFALNVSSVAMVYLFSVFEFFADDLL